MARIPQHLIRLRDEKLADGESILWQGRPDALAGLRYTGATWFLSLPWIAMTLFANWMKWIDGATTPLLMVGGAFAVIPILFFIRDLQTLFVITDRRALVVRGVWKDNKASADSTALSQMQSPRAEVVSGHVGHLMFASGMSTRKEDSDEKGRYGFRNIKNVEKVRDLLADAISKKVRAK